jgi:tetratricopeptide (TPR) repeat protein
MNSARKESVVQGLRPLIVAFTLISVGAYFFSMEIPIDETATNQNRLKALGYAFAGVLFIATGSAVLLLPLARFISTLFGSLFWPNGAEVAPALHKLPEWYIGEGRYAEALVEYEKMLLNNPRQLEAIQGLLYVLSACMGDVVSADKRYHKALKKISSPDREVLKNYYYELLENRVAAPDHSQTTPWD